MPDESSAKVASEHAAAMLLAMAVSTALGNPRWLAALGLWSLARWIRGRRTAGGRARLTGANAITALRVALVASLGLVDHGSTTTAGLVVLLVFMLDGVDGWWARRTNTQTTFGAAFDQEADAFLVAMGCTVAVMGHAAPRWVLVAGALRYGYVIVVHAVDLHGEAPRSTIARYVFGIVVVSMSAALLVPHPVTRAALSGATLLLVWSFGRSLWWSWRGPR